MNDELIKHRQITFVALHPDPHQAQTALLLLSDLPGIIHHHLQSDTSLHVSYRIDQITLKAIEQLLSALGFHLDNSLLCKLKRALFYYTEDTQRANLGCPQPGDNTTRQVFIEHYHRRKHGCRDDRPHHWRIYR